MKKLAMIMMSLAVMLMLYASAVPHHHHHHELACFAGDFNAHEDEGCDDEENVCVAHESYVISHDCADVDFFPVFVVVLNPDLVPEVGGISYFKHESAPAVAEAPELCSQGLRAPPYVLIEA